ncbi:5-(carboxyamino)imidazole ribonucleotide synthase [Paraglaciecola aquimarina]|uniref:N5-carboxyaminoimidazole ribonucleotide synthase n=1 Tax=Paraglaciecola aquimarina TaxID=1235557 RepID=A0ABU3SSE7_9ALTE|nr:5-(carboxyamino)imidazole ribonucleotide synthase [Paraglaciecola aquimarina]MDU0352946.1 5-(carboxyamino)imidazole ribonucleotide synthase [Paraglaciecola aquimarina]
MSILVLGSGQLARMMALAGHPLGLHVQAVDVADNKIVDPISKDVINCTLDTAINEANVVTVEFEHIPEALLETVHASGKLKPNVESILTGADRVREKTLLEKLNIANCPFSIVTDVEQLDAAMEKLGEKLIIKASRDGYDGYGQWRLQDKSQLPKLKEALSKLDLQKVPLIVEKMLSFEREVSLVAVRNVEGEFAFYPLAENLHYEGQLHVSIAPATEVDEALNQQAQDIFTKLAESLDYVGVLAVEFFQIGQQLLVNEIAPRVHNSGHWTMQGAETCQFENHLRAVRGLPLGSTKVKSPTAMINIIGCKDFDRDMLSIPGCHLHWYGKTARAKRKMGHFNLCADNYKELAKVIGALSEYLPAEYFPMLKDEAIRLAEF